MTYVLSFSHSLTLCLRPNQPETAKLTEKLLFTGERSYKKETHGLWPEREVETTSLSHLHSGFWRMKLIEYSTAGKVEDGDYGGSNEDGNGKLVVVGVKLDSQSCELLTWALVKVAQSGDHVIAVHVLDSIAEGTSSLLSLVKTFDSVLSVYEGFCNLKQVHLKLKVCRGSSVRKTLVGEAKSYSAATVIVGTSKAHYRIQSSASVAKYCARKLSRSFSVFAIDNGKVVFFKKATPTNADQFQDANSSDKNKNYAALVLKPSSKNVHIRNNLKLSKCHHRIRKSCSACRKETQKLDNLSYVQDLVSLDNSAAQSEDDLSGDEGEVNSLALVPVQTYDLASNSMVVRDSKCLKPGWALLRSIFLPKRQNTKRSAGLGLKLPSWNRPSVVHPDQKQNSIDQDEDHISIVDGESRAIVPFESIIVCPSHSPNNALKSLPQELLNLHEKYLSTCKLFSFQELSRATSNFLPENIVGKGGSSDVYRGSLPDGTELAVKILKQSEDVLKEFVQEIDIITSLNHKNIISLFGFCFENHKLLLVYNFLSRGSLEEKLHGNKKDGNAFGWKERYHVAVGVAQALDYLHNGCAEPVIHRDVKSSNILLSDDFEPQLSDFGLANRASASSHITFTDVAGTFGYLAPEYFMHGKVSDKIDVYALGVVLLELLSGRKPINNEYPEDEQSLVIWAKPVLKGGKVSQLLDPSLGSNYDDDQIERMIFAATLCIRREPRLRPQISLVLKLLQGDEEVVMWARQQVSMSEEPNTVSEEPDTVEGEMLPANIQSHLNLALLDLDDDDSLSINSSQQSISLEDYLQGRWSRSSSFD